MTTKDKKRMINVFFGDDEERRESEVTEALDHVAPLVPEESVKRGVNLGHPILNPKYTEMQQRVVDSDMTIDELRVLVKKYSNERFNNPNGVPPLIFDKRVTGPDGKPVSLYFGEYAAEEQQRRAASQALGDQFVLEQKINRLKEDTI